MIFWLLLAAGWLLCGFPCETSYAQEATLPGEAQNLLNKSKTWNRYQAKFSLEAQEEGEEAVRLEGNLVVQRPKNRRLEIRFEGEEELSQLHVSNGEVEWQYIPQAETAYKAVNPPEVPGPHRPFADVEISSVQFVKQIDQGGEKLYRFEADPLESIAQGAPVLIKRVQIDLAETDGLARQVVLFGDKGEKVLTQKYYDIQLDVPISSETFTFALPKGVEVVEVEL
jgi:outer membrane lipoprotein-sorting protein